MELKDLNRTMTRRDAIRDMGWMGAFGGLALGTTGLEAPFFRPRAQATAFALVNGAGVSIDFRDLGTTAAAGWAYDYGEGRVCYLSPGHLIEAMWNPEYEKVQQNAVRWLLRQS